MADVYTQFSAILKLTDADQIKWSSHLLAVLGKIHDLSDYGEAPVVTLEVLATAGNDPDIDLAKEMLSLYEKNFKPFCSDQLPAEMQEQVDEDQGLWFHADENGNVDFAATIVHVILKKFNLDTVRLPSPA